MLEYSILSFYTNQFFFLKYNFRKVVMERNYKILQQQWFFLSQKTAVNYTNYLKTKREMKYRPFHYLKQTNDGMYMNYQMKKYIS